MAGFNSVALEYSQEHLPGQIQAIYDTLPYIVQVCLTEASTGNPQAVDLYADYINGIDGHAFDMAKIACDSIKKDGNRTVIVYQSTMGESIGQKTFILRHFGEALEKHPTPAENNPQASLPTGANASAAFLFPPCSRPLLPCAGCLYYNT